MNEGGVPTQPDREVFKVHEMIYYYFFFFESGRIGKTHIFYDLAAV